MKLRTIYFSIFICLTSNCFGQLSTGLEEIASKKSNLWKHTDTEWTRWMVVSVAPTRIYFESWSDEERQRFYNDFDPDYLDMWSGQAMNRGNFFRMRGTAVNSPMEYEYDCLINPVYGHSNIFQDNGIGRKEDGTIAVVWFRPGATPPSMCHMAPLWHNVVTQGMVRTIPYGDSVFQDNIANNLYTWNMGFCDWCNKRFIDYIVERFSKSQLDRIGFDPGTFHIRDYLASKRKKIGDNPDFSGGQFFQEEYTKRSTNAHLLLSDPIIHEYIRFQHISYLLYWIDCAEKSKQTAMKLGKPIPACYGNIPRIGGIRTFPTLMASQVDIAWSEESTDMQPCFRDDRQAWSALLYKVGRAVSYYSKPVISVQYQGGDKSIYDEPGKKSYPTAITCSEAIANGGILCQTWVATEFNYLRKNPGWDKVFYETNRKHADFASRNRSLFTDRTSVAEVALVYSFPTTFWRGFQSLQVDTPHKDSFSAVARILEDNHIPYEIMPFGHKDIFDDSYFFDRINKYKMIIIPNADCISSDQEERIEKWVKQGGNLLVLGNVGIFDEELNTRSKRAFAGLSNDSGLGSITVVSFEETHELTYGKGILPVSREIPRQWKYVLDAPDDKWSSVSFEDSGWKVGKAPFGKDMVRGTKPHTLWDSNEIWMRSTFTLDKKPLNPILYLQHWWDVEVYVNGTLVAARKGRGHIFEPYQYLEIISGAKDAIIKGENIIAVHCTRNIEHPTYGQFIDVGIRDMPSDEEIVKSIKQKYCSLIETDLPRSVWLNIWRHGAGPMTSVQMVNYDVDLKKDKMNSVEKFFVRFKKQSKAQYDHAFYYSNDFDKTIPVPQKLKVEDKGDLWEVEVPRLDVLGVLVFASEDEILARTAASETRKYLERLKISQRCEGSTLNNKKLISNAAEILSRIQGNVKVTDFNSLKAKLMETTNELQMSLNKSVKEIEQYQNKLANDVFDVNAVYKFDFGDQNAPDGWLPVTPETVYSPDKGYGWTEKGPIQSIDYGLPDPVHGDFIRTICFDGINKVSEPETYTGKFKIDCENGKYFVTVITGSYGVFPVKGTHNEGKTSMTFVKANGQLKILGDRLSSGYFENRSFIAEVKDGSLLLEFYGKNIGPLYANSVQWLVNGLLIQKMEQKPTDAALDYFKKNQLLKKTAIKDWAILAPFDDSQCEKMESKPNFEKMFSKKASFEGKNGPINWKQWHYSGDEFAVVPLDELVSDSFRVIGFAKTYVYSPKEQEVFLLGSFSQLGMIYLDHKEVYRDDLAAGLFPEEIKVRVSLRQGWNEIMIRSSNHWGTDWSLWAGLLTTNGQPLVDQPGIIISAGGDQ